MDTIPLYRRDNPDAGVTVHLAEEQPPAAQEASALAKPFVVVNRRTDPKPGGAFTPAALVGFTSSLRTSGFLASFAPESLQDLLLLLTFVHPNGHCQPSLVELSHALGISLVATRVRFRELAACFWQGEPVVVIVPRESGLDAVAPSPHLLGQWVEGTIPDRDDRPPLPSAGRDAVVAHARAAYARPREEAEADVARQMGEIGVPAPTTPEAPEAAALRQRLEVLGVAREQAQELVTHYPPEQIARQIEWLPYRSARTPASFLVAAIQRDFEKPRGYRQQRPTSQDRAHDQHDTSL